MSKQLSKLIILFILLSLDAVVNAQRFAGAEIYYELIGPKAYKVTTHVYRECDASTLQKLYAYVISGSTRRDLDFKRTSITKINDTCGNPCDVQNDISNPGFERHTFVATVDFVNDTNYRVFVKNNLCDIVFAIQNGGRDPRITTQTPGVFYVDAGVNICDTNIKYNHSPVFSIDPKFLMACNQPFKYSPGPMDSTDYDSLAFSLEPVLIGYNTGITYKGNFSYDIPLTPYCPPTSGAINCRPLPNAKPPRGFYFDILSCQIIMTPTKCDELGYVKIKIREYRKIKGQMVQLGYVCREMLMAAIVVQDNNPTYITYAPNAPVICGNIAINTHDDPFLPKQTVPDTTNIFWDFGYRNGQMIIDSSSREKTANLILPPNNNNTLTKQYFTIGYYDHICNVALNSQTFIGINYPKVFFKTSFTVDPCNILRYQVKPVDSAFSISGNVTLYSSSGTVISSSGKPTDSIIINTPGRYYLCYDMLANSMSRCHQIKFDTIDIISTFPKPKLNVIQDTAVCASTPVALRFNASKIPGLRNIAWYKNDTLVNSSDSFYSTTIFKATTFRVHLVSNNNCHSETILRYSLITFVQNVLGNDLDTVCSGTPLKVIANSPPNYKAPIHYEWTINGNNLYQDTGKIALNPIVTTRISLRMKDDNHCIISDSLFIPVGENPEFTISTGKPEFCKDSIQPVALKNFKMLVTSIIWTFNGTDTVRNATIQTRSYNKPTRIRVMAVNYTGCTHVDSLFLDPIDVPSVSLSSVKALCKGDSARVIARIKPHVSQKTYSWTLNGNTLNNHDSSYMFKSTVSGNLGVKVANKLGCYSIDSSNITVKPKPVPVIVGDTNYHHSNFIKLSTAQPHKTYIWSNSVFTRNNDFWANTLGSPGKYTIILNVTDSNDCSGSDTINLHTDQFTSTADITGETFALYPNPASQQLNIEVLRDEFVTIFAIDGRQVMHMQLSEGINTIDISGLAKGMYTVRVANCPVIFIKE